MLPIRAEGMERDTLTMQRAPPAQSLGMEEGGTPDTAERVSLTKPGNRGGHPDQAADSLQEYTGFVTTIGLLNLRTDKFRILY